MYSALGAGSILGAMIFAIYGHRMPRRATILTGFTIRALTFWVLVLMPPVGVVVATIIINATALEPSNPIVMTILQERIPDGMRGRVFGSLSALSVAAMPIGMVGYGLLINEFGLQTTLYVFASLNLLLPLMLAVTPAMRAMGKPDDSAEPKPMNQPAMPA
jgi:MFS family permease